MHVKSILCAQRYSYTDTQKLFMSAHLSVCVYIFCMTNPTPSPHHPPSNPQSPFPPSLSACLCVFPWAFIQASPCLAEQQGPLGSRHCGISSITGSQSPQGHSSPTPAPHTLSASIHPPTFSLSPHCISASPPSSLRTHTSHPSVPAATHWAQSTTPHLNNQPKQP